MVHSLVCLVFVSALAAPQASFAQPSQETETASARSRALAGGSDQRDELPVSLTRIRRRLAAQPAARQSKDRLRLEYYINVYGQAPRLELFVEGENVTSAPVRYGGMTHQEFLSVVTPQEFRAPAADIPGAVAALIKWAMEKNKNNDRH
ncbi:MAG TPA: hypothetical protein VK886_02640 [Vicinamibacterales bacterium]|nr:hypothetical protein [Vicinamibacterales bacterium]